MIHSTTLGRVSLLATLLTLGACSTTATAPTTAPSGQLGALGPYLMAVEARLTGNDEMPSNSSNGIGDLKGSFDTRTRVLKWRLVYSGLSGPATMAHFHGPALRRQNAGVVLPFPGTVSPIEGQATLTEAQANDLLNGRWYANVHTLLQPAGEIRGQVTLR
ncbi:MAG: CHRD domain-containing protein [Burkholderiaceae bacterium]